MNFTESELTTISNALRIAAEQFRENVKELEKMQQDARIIDQFARQALDAARLYEKIEAETGVAT